VTRPSRCILLWMRVFASSLVLALAGCVPATAETEPRGAIALRTEPSAASRGETVTTADGWSLTIETFVMQVTINARSADATLGMFGGGDVLFHGGRREDLVVMRIPAGPAVGLVTFSWLISHDGDVARVTSEIRDVSPDLVERFLLAPSGKPPSAPSFVIGPSLLVAGRARKGDRTLEFDLGLRGPIEHHAAPVVIAANALTPVPVPIAVEALFTNVDGALAFDEIAAADTNRDGVLTPEELDEATTSCAECSGWQYLPDEDGSFEPSVLDMLHARISRIIALPVDELSWRDAPPPPPPLASGEQTRDASPP